MPAHPTHTMIFPVEVLSSIVRQATLVPEVLDTSPSIYFENHDAVIRDICDSMKTKVSLSSVSKTFHDVMENYLYEVVMIFRFQYVPTLLQRLHSMAPASTTPRGHRCRRLDLYLGVGNIPYDEEAWYEGGHTLWGLVPACPNLEILVARVIGTKLYMPCLTHKALWKTIAACCAKTIRRLDLFGLEIRMDRVEMMLRHLTKLEACSIGHVTKFDPLKDIYDDEEPKKRVISKGRCYAPIVFKDDWDYTTPSVYFSALTVSEFKAAKENSCWPLFTASAPYTLPHLHTLRLDDFDSKRITQFNFPRLRHLDMYCYSKIEGLSSSRGFIPDSLTHLTYAGESASIAQIIGFFPQLRFLNLPTEYCKFPDSHFTNPHACLEVVELATWYRYCDPKPQIKEILVAVQNRNLPSLRMIQVTRPGKCPAFHDLSPVEKMESAALGLTLQVVIRKRPIISFLAR
ncbi:hypothetical protein H2248_004471 [Termitomyces sp. 'cryptogamus']|nr:hypothetical protein H2248_004471 [Termitomyces sp. 'cryptogamus']